MCKAFLTFCLSVFAANAQTAPPDQPLPFSHAAHAGTLKLACKMCHTNPPPGEMMTFAKTSVCMNCHATIKSDSPLIQKLAAAAKDDRSIKWVRVYQVPSYVSFSHKSHLDSGNKCDECHGPVATRNQLAREGDISMGGCMNCHRQKRASIDCTYCHEERPN